MTDFKTSETAKNLMRAFAGESQARNRYTFAAGLAKEQKMPMVEAVFRYTADQEKEHAEIFYDYLKPLDKETIFIDGGYPVDLEKNTLAQLNAAAHNEYEEHDVVYKSFGDIAQKEGFSQIAATFRMIAEIEKTHGERFQYLADLLGAGNLYVSPQKETWICTNCGYSKTIRSIHRHCLTGIEQQPQSVAGSTQHHIKGHRRTGLPSQSGCPRIKK